MNIKLLITLLAPLALGSVSFCFGMQALEARKKPGLEVFSKRIGKKDLIGLLDGEIQTHKTVISLIEQSYEKPHRYIDTKVDGKQYGNAYSLHPEILAHVMSSSQDKVVLELGAARGENGILMGLAGAREVYINDINPAELEEGKKAIRQLPPHMQKKYTLVAGDCLTVFSDASFEGRFDVIYARNLFHFFLGKNREKFVRELSRLLKPGGRLILAVNSAFQPTFSEALKKQPSGYVFARRTPMYRPVGKTPQMVTGYGDVTVETDLSTVDPVNFSWTTLIEFNNGKIEQKNSFSALSVDSQKKVLAYALELVERKGLKALAKSGDSIDCHLCHSICYTKDTIRQAFAQSDFELIQTVSIDDACHVTNTTDDEFGLTAIFEKRMSGVPVEYVQSEQKEIKAPASADDVCGFCSKTLKVLKKCSRCKNASYCGAACQKQHWATHKQVCVAAQLPH